MKNQNKQNQKITGVAFIIILSIVVISTDAGFVGLAAPAQASYHFANYTAHPPLHVYATTGKKPAGVTPSQIKKIYNLPATGGKGTIVIVGAYDDKAIASDLAAFDTAFALPTCSISNGCFTQHLMSAKESDNSGWDMETALDVEWAHAIAPQAKILLVEAKTASGANLLAALDYAAAQKSATAISMSWGGAEFSEETTLDSHFVSASGAPFFASSGDNGAGASWPAASPKVIGVGGTSLALGASLGASGSSGAAGISVKETAWQGSGGGVSAYEKEPTFQQSYNIPKAHGMRAIPDVSYDADPASGFPIVHNGVWHTVGGTSAGAPQWAAIAALGSGATSARLYTDKSSTKSTSFFRDIVSGENGNCGFYCDARARYDYVTGLGTPQTVSF